MLYIFEIKGKTSFVLGINIVTIQGTPLKKTWIFLIVRDSIIVYCG